MCSRRIWKTFIATALLAILLAVLPPAVLGLDLVRAGDTSLLQSSVSSLAGGGQYSTDQAVSDKAQLSTIAFSGLAFITGNAGADTFFPPGKVADFFGFQYMRDVDTAGYGHNTQFLSRVADNVLFILTDEQKARLVALAREQAPVYNRFAYNRLPLINAFRRSLSGDLPAGATALDGQTVAAYTAALYENDAELSYGRAVAVGAIIQSFSDSQKAYLDKMAFDDFDTWPDVSEDSAIKNGLTNSEYVCVMTYASELFSWYKGSVDSDAYFCPERHGTYFGGFFMKDYLAMNNPDYFISTTVTDEKGQAFLNTLDSDQRALIEGIIPAQKTALTEIVQIRREVSAELRKAMTGSTVDKDRITALIRRYGELDGTVSALYAQRFSDVYKTLTTSQRASLITLRDLDAQVDGTYLFSTLTQTPNLPDTDFFFGTAAMPADAGLFAVPAGFGDTASTPTDTPSTPSTQSFDGSILLSRPTCTEMTVSVTPKSGSCSVYAQWGSASGSLTQKSGTVTASPENPAAITLTSLAPDKVFYYQIAYKTSDGTDYTLTPENHFQMPRTADNPYSFVIQSDSHLLNKADPTLYTQSLATMAALNPDFMLDLGDTFLNDQVDAANRLYQDAAAIRDHYTQQLPYLGIVASSAPLYLATGNHEGEYGHFFDGTASNLAAMATLDRKTYYHNPVPNDFYTGNTETESVCGQPENYFAYTWGDALYVVIDPYRYTTADPYAIGSGWDWTLGKTQYDWFKKTLESSDAKYKFVFCHHAVGNTRGGAETASLYEWGGYDKNGCYLFDEKRPGWGKPIQKIMEDTGVTIFFQGHDHLFARESVGSVIYQTLPKPAEAAADSQCNADTYPDADILANSGFLSVTVGSDSVQVDYHRQYCMLDTLGGNPATGVVYSYKVDAGHHITPLSGTSEDLSGYGKGTPVGTGDSTDSPASGTVSFGNTAGEDFTFDIQADSHLDENTDTSLYRTALSQMAADAPAFLMDLGDTSMVEKLTTTYDEAVARFDLQKSYLSALGTIPLFLVNGNHDGELGWLTNQQPAWEKALREQYFPNPLTGISGYTAPSRGNYYAFTYGKALFVVLDPYTFTTSKRQSDTDGWSCTLGRTQYDWLAQTLSESQATYKFVFIHNLVGGIGKDSRGGMEAASYFEWGGANADGTDGFSSQRPGWAMPIHDLLVQNGVTAVFHGHDHFYASQEKNGIRYIMAPQPGTPGNSVLDATSYGYQSGDFQPSPGYLRVHVTSAGVTVEKVATGEASATAASIHYDTHIQNIGWQSPVSDGTVSGTTGQSLRLEGIHISLADNGIDGSVQYRTHIQNIGWEKDFVSNGALSGTTGQSLRLEAIQIRLTGDMADRYDIYYQVHAQNIGWMGWAKDGESAGTIGMGYRLEAIRILLVPKGGNPPASDTGEALVTAASIYYDTHIQSIGWQSPVSDGTVSGTTGQSLRLEGIHISLADNGIDGSVQYRTHIQNIGWEKDFVSNGALSGTTGQSLRLEAIQIRLTGDMADRYDIYYQVHAQNIGWMGWAKDGESAGTAGMAYRLEAIRILLVPKGGNPPASDTGIANFISQSSR